MDNQTNIPSVELNSPISKAFGFRIASNRELLLNDKLGFDPFRPHRIHFHAILFIFEGTGHHYIDFQKYPYQKGSIVFISKEQVHAFEKNWNRKAFFLLFNEDFLERGGFHSQLMQQLSLYQHFLYRPVVQLEATQMPLFMQLIQQMKNEFAQRHTPLAEEIIHAALKIFLCLAERIRKESGIKLAQSQYQSDFLVFQKLLKQHIFESRKVQFYAEKMLMSSKKLNRITQDIIGKNAKNHIHDFLVLEIKRLLMNTNLLISEIAYKTGFPETTNFVKYFKKQTQRTPSEFRAQF